MELLTSNEPPLDPELSEIRSKAAAHVDRLAILDKTIADMQNTVQLMRSEREWVAAELAELRQVSSPVRRLPPEVLSEIFLACINEDIFHKTHLEDSLDARKAPWVLSRICRRWRGIATSDARLWSTICIDLTKPRQSMLGTVLLLGLQLQRTKNRTLNVWIQSDVPAITSDHYLLQILLPTADRWRQAVIVLCWNSFLALGPIHSLGSLEALRIQFNDRILPTTSLPWIDIFRYAPRLRFFRCHDHIGPTSIMIPWSQITTYEWQVASDPPPISAPRHIHTIRIAPRLENCELVCTQVDDWSLQDPLTRSDLRRMHITVYRWGGSPGYVGLLKCLTLPALEDFSLALDHNIAFDTDCIVHLFQRSQCAPVNLSLNAPSLTSGQLLGVLRAVPSLERLSIGAYRSDGAVDIVEKLIWRPGANNGDVDNLILPHLTKLELPADSVITQTSFVEMVESRTPEPGQNSACAHLQLVILKNQVAFPIDLLSRMKQCCSRGLKFVNSDAELTS